MATKYVWLNLNTGQFSNSWTEDFHNKYAPSDLLDDKAPEWKLIKYECVNDETFEFYGMMKIVTNTKN